MCCNITIITGLATPSSPPHLQPIGVHRMHHKVQSSTESNNIFDTCQSVQMLLLRFLRSCGAAELFILLSWIVSLAQLVLYVATHTKASCECLLEFSKRGVSPWPASTNTQELVWPHEDRPHTSTGAVDAVTSYSAWV